MCVGVSEWVKDEYNYATYNSGVCNVDLNELIYGEMLSDLYRNQVVLNTSQLSIWWAGGSKCTLNSRATSSDSEKQSRRYFLYIQIKQVDFKPLLIFNLCNYKIKKSLKYQIFSN